MMEQGKTCHTLVFTIKTIFVSTTLITNLIYEVLILKVFVPNLIQKLYLEEASCYIEN